MSESRSFVCSSRTTGIYQSEVLLIVRDPRVRRQRGADMRTGWGLRVAPFLIPAQPGVAFSCERTVVSEF